jgi:hypothetical protein
VIACVNGKNDSWVAHRGGLMFKNYNFASIEFEWIGWFWEGQDDRL